MNTDWGTDAEWLRAALNIMYRVELGMNVKEEVVKYLDANPDKRGYGKLILEQYGVWNGAIQLAKELDLKIQP